MSISSVRPNGAPNRRTRVLAIAYACHPEESAESRVGWARVIMASRNHDVTVLCSPETSHQELRRLALRAGATIRFVGVQHSQLGGYCYQHDLLHILGYRLWHRAAFREALRLHDQQPFDLVHQVNFCSYREPGYCWRLDVPFVWGPVGGTQYFPIRYLGVTDYYNGAREVARNVVNWFQLRISHRVRRIARDDRAVILSATTTAQRDLEQHIGAHSHVELEAGLSYEPLPARPRRDPRDPLRILWTGRLRPWKGLPMLLRALAELPEGVRYELRILGEGAEEPSLRRLAQRLGVDSHLQWAGWGPYSTTLPHYQWADVFAFTSLRDTSGAGLLEALAAGAPVISLNHQGAADILDETCAALIEPVGPKQTIAALAQAFKNLHDDPVLLERLSRGATRRAERFQWNLRTGFLDEVYQQALGLDEPAETPASSVIPNRQLAAASPTYEQIA